MAQQTTAADLAARIEQMRNEHQVRNQDLAEARQAHSVKTSQRQQLLVEQEIDGMDHTKRIAALDTDLARLGVTVEQKAAAAAHMPAVLAELQKRQTEALVAENVHERQRLADAIHADVDELKKLFAQAQTIQQRANAAYTQSENLRGDSWVSTAYVAAPSLLRDGVLRFMECPLPQ